MDSEYMCEACEVSPLQVPAPSCLLYVYLIITEHFKNLTRV